MKIECFGDEDYSTLTIRLVHHRDQFNKEFEFDLVPSVFQQIMLLGRDVSFSCENEYKGTLKISSFSRSVTFRYNNVSHTFTDEHYDELLKEFKYYYDIFEKNGWYVHETD